MQLSLNSSPGGHGIELDQRGPIETSQSEPLHNSNLGDTPVKLGLNSSGNKPEIQIQRLSHEIKELERGVQQMRQNLEECYKTQRDLTNERSKIKQRFQSCVELSRQACEMLQLLLKQHILQQQNLDYEHKNSQQEVQLKIKEAQTYSLSEQLKLRDEVIMRTRNALKETIGASPGS